MIEWVEGIVDDDSGNAMRQIPIDSTCNIETSSLWISEDGILKRRYYNPWSAEFTWGDMIEPKLENDVLSVRMGKNNVSLDYAIASAWVRRPSKKTSKVMKICEDEPSIAHNLKWTEDDSEADESEDEWEEIEESFHISKKRKYIRAPNGQVYRGSFNGSCRVAAVGDKMIRLDPPEEDAYLINSLSPSLLRAAMFIIKGKHPLELCKSANIGIETAWSYYSKAANKINTEQLLYWIPKIVNKDLWNFLVLLHMQNEAILGSSLKDLAQHVENFLVSDSWKVNEHKLNEIRLSRVCISKMRMEEC